MADTHSAFFCTLLFYIYVHVFVQMRLFQHLDEKLQHMERELATNPQYVQKVIGDNVHR